jgi:hypothetical protein
LYAVGDDRSDPISTAIRGSAEKTCLQSVCMSSLEHVISQVVTRHHETSRDMTIHHVTALNST